jgi:hypothetical protein
MIFGLVFALIVAVPPQSSSPESHATMQERAQDAYERHHQTAIRVNGLAGKIHSQADADTIISEIAELFAKELPPIWATSNVRQRVAHAEFEAVNSPANNALPTFGISTSERSERPTKPLSPLLKFTICVTDRSRLPNSCGHMGIKRSGRCPMFTRSGLMIRSLMVAGPLTPYV